MCIPVFVTRISRSPSKVSATRSMLRLSASLIAIGTAPPRPVRADMAGGVYADKPEASAGSLPRILAYYGDRSRVAKSGVPETT